MRRKDFYIYNKNYFMWYNYIYLDPNKPGDFIYDEIELKYEPFYVGKGMGTRYYGHLNDKTKINEHKINKINKILKLISKEDYKKNFIFIFNYSENEKDVLLKEKDLIEKIGTVVNVPNVSKRGPLLNLMEGGGINPILNGELNGMYGKSIVDVWKKKYSEEEIKEKYDKWIKNLSGRTPRLGIKHTDETKKKISNKHKGIPSPMKGKKNSNVNLKKWGNSIKGKTFEEIYNKEKSDEIKNKISNSNIGRKISKEHIEKLRILNTGKILSEETKRKIGEKNKGRKPSKETLKKLSIASSGERNPMYKNGHKVSGNKNGRSVYYIVHTPTGEKYFCHGTFKKFCKDVLSKIKPMPHRKYLYRCLKENTTIDGWYFQKLKSLDEININDYIRYE